MEEKSAWAQISFLKAKGGERGQSLLESLALCLVLTALIQGALFLFWIWSCFLWMEHQLYQGLICAAQQKEIRFCESEAAKQIKKLSALGAIKSLKITGFKNQWKGEIKWSLNKKNFLVRQTLSLPR